MIRFPDEGCTVDGYPKSERVLEDVLYCELVFIFFNLQIAENKLCWINNCTGKEAKLKDALWGYSYDKTNEE